LIRNELSGLDDLDDESNSVPIIDGNDAFEYVDIPNDTNANERLSRRDE